MVESDAWFRLRWFLVGSLGAVLTVFVLRGQARSAVVATRPPPVIPMPTAQPLEPDPAPPPEPKVEPKSVPPTPAVRARASAAAPAAAPASAEPAPPPVSVVPPTTRASRDMAKVQDALTSLRQKPNDGGARTRLERAIERAALDLPDIPRNAVLSCVTQAGFEGRGSVATARLADCVEKLKRAQH